VLQHRVPRESSARPSFFEHEHRADPIVVSENNKTHARDDQIGVAVAVARIGRFPCTGARRSARTLSPRNAPTVVCRSHST